MPGIGQRRQRKRHSQYQAQQGGYQLAVIIESSLYFLWGLVPSLVGLYSITQTGADCHPRASKSHDNAREVSEIMSQRFSHTVSLTMGV